MSVGPFGIDPLYFSLCLFGGLLLFVLYLLLPRGARVAYFNGHQKRYVWSARARRRRNNTPGAVAMSAVPSGQNVSASALLYGNRNNVQALGAASNGTGSNYSNAPMRGYGNSNGNSQYSREETINFENSNDGGARQRSIASVEGPNGDEAAISAAMTQLRDPGVLIVAHGSRGKPKTVRLQLTDSAITWRTETRKKSGSGQQSKDIKLGKLHSVSLANIMYVDVGKQTTALRRVENASVPESLCFSLLTKEGSLDLEANSPRERDALVSCFSLVLDEVHAQNWRDIYRGPSGDMPSSFDEYDEEAGGAAAVNSQQR